MREIIGSMKNMTVLEESVSLKSALRTDQTEEIDRLVDALTGSVKA